ncbi:hypothetical protein [Mucilaginibacter arboris]|uniref:Late embryogenesis abundant protein n=1 Tax=Mucilaginibacter arboris TaxID=2682090 RepID=A0A7K1T035_9SPHI|nr:hypothetical protein [Mucilaginibacter arboris]MVN22926.1 hypothetical protein [Mucilaginibacter arboris]
MKNYKLLLLLPLTFLLSRCGVNKQIEQAKALGKCRFELVSADSVYLSGINMNQFKDMDNVNIGSLPRLAMGLLSHNVPLDARLVLKITNPTAETAAINQFEYKVLLRNSEVFTGYVNQRVEVAPVGGQTRVPINITTNAYHLITDDQTREAFANLVQNLSGAKNAHRSVITIKIKPTLDLGNKAISYPGYITFDKEIGR